MTVRIVLLTLALGTLALAAATVPASAMRDPLGSCGEDVIVEVCQPVCVTEPCYGYVCVHTQTIETCHYP